MHQRVLRLASARPFATPCRRLELQAFASTSSAPKKPQSSSRSSYVPHKDKDDREHNRAVSPSGGGTSRKRGKDFFKKVVNAMVDRATERPADRHGWRHHRKGLRYEEKKLEAAIKSSASQKLEKQTVIQRLAEVVDTDKKVERAMGRPARMPSLAKQAFDAGLDEVQALEEDSMARGYPLGTFVESRR